MAMGCPPTDSEGIFLPFQRLGDVPNGDGLGLGLAVARGLTEAMGGTVTRRGHPRRRPHRRRRPARPLGIDRNIAMTTVLAVDDDPTLLDTLELNLQARGYAVLTAGDGHTAITLCRAGPTRSPGARSRAS